MYKLKNKIRAIFSNQITRVVTIGIIILIMSVMIPIFMDKFIIGNNIKSNITNEQWVGFLGNYLGALIGSVITIYVLAETMIYNNSNLKAQIILNEIDKIQKIKDDQPIISINPINIKSENSANYIIEFEDIYDIKNQDAYIHIGANAFCVINIGINYALNIKFTLIDENDIKLPIRNASKNSFDNLPKELQHSSSFIFIIRFFTFKCRDLKLIIEFEDKYKNKYIDNYNVFLDKGNIKQSKATVVIEKI